MEQLNDCIHEDNCAYILFMIDSNPHVIPLPTDKSAVRLQKRHNKVEFPRVVAFGSDASFVKLPWGQDTSPIDANQ